MGDWTEKRRDLDSSPTVDKIRKVSWQQGDVSPNVHIGPSNKLLTHSPICSWDRLQPPACDPERGPLIRQDLS